MLAQYAHTRVETRAEAVKLLQCLNKLTACRLCIATIGTSQRTAEDEIGAGRDEREANRVVPAYRLLEIEDREGSEDQERDDLLNGLELRGGVDGAAPAVGRH